MKIKHFYTAFALITVSFLFIAAVNSNENDVSKTNKDIIKFSHIKHTEMVECASCHTLVSESTSLKDRLLPEKSVCATCHDVEDTDNCNFCHYEDVNEPLIQKESELIYNHKMHVADQKLDCTKCHKGLDKVEYSFEADEAFPKMNVCYSCHNDVSIATNNCESCHSSTVNLIPQDHQRVGFFKSHRFKAESMNSDCEMCHNNTFCETCHASTTMITEKNTARDFITPFSPHKFVDNTKQQSINRIHDLNYRFTHGIDAKSKSMECSTCHQTETFCAECHNTSGGDYAMEGFVPMNHKAPNFITIGIGSGGGEHAKLAKRDIENCAACHDVQGADANCIMCHTDPDGIRGTNPKTHINNFMRSVKEGDWHSDFNSICYSCHRDANARPGGIKGIGFCSYCHNK